MSASTNPVPCGGATVSFETAAVGVSAEGPLQGKSKPAIETLYGHQPTVSATPRLRKTQVCQGQWPLRIRHVPRQGAMCEEK